MDADVAHHLMEKCILGILKNKTRIVCTHRVEFVDKADVVVLMDNGMIVKTGTVPVFLMTLSVFAYSFTYCK